MQLQRPLNMMLLSSIACSFRFKVGVISKGGSSSFFSNTALRLGASASPTIERADRVSHLKEILKIEGVDAFIVPTEDPHNSEYTAPFFNRREFISGFTGSAGTVIVTKEKAVLFTDGRYHEQADKELDKEWVLMKRGLKDVPSPLEFISSSLKAGETVAFDPFLHTAAEVKRMQSTFTKHGIATKQLTRNPIDEIWGTSRPPAPTGKIRVHPMEYAGKSVTQKLADLRVAMKKESAGAVIASALDEIAWLYNIRGADVPCNPVIVSYAIVTLDNAYFFVDESKLTANVESHFAQSQITVLPYEQVLSKATAIASALKDQAAIAGSESGACKFWVDSKTVNYAVYSAVSACCECVENDSPVILMKACKNERELAGMRAAHQRDAAAMVEFFSWLDAALSSEEIITEVDIDVKVTEMRRQLSPPGFFLEPSFPTIAGVGSNGAIIHYRASDETCRKVEKGQMLLLDSGGQYLDGTTDVTRTIFLAGETEPPSDFQREMFTRVLKGNIALDQCVFPAGTAGCLLDSLTRQHLWRAGLDFMHGTGHGVGAALNVHEGPHSISRVLTRSQPLVPGMVVSNEPGFYDSQSGFGIRIENLLMVQVCSELPEYQGRGFLRFEKLTLIPIQRKLIVKEMLTVEELQWIDNYHMHIRKTVGPMLRTETAKTWLHDSTLPL